METLLLKKIKERKIKIDTPVKTVLILNNKKYYCLTTGEIFDDKKELRKKYYQNETFLIKEGVGNAKTIFVKYHEDLDMISLSKIQISRENPSSSVFSTRQWDEIFTLWVTPEKEVFYFKDNGLVICEKIKDVPEVFLGDILEYYTDRNTLLYEFSRLFKTNEKNAIYFTNPSKCEILRKIDTVMNFIFYKDIKKLSGPKQKKIDELSSFITTTLKYEEIVENINEKYASINLSSGDQYYKLIYELLCYKLEKVNDSYCVLRIFYFNRIYQTSEEIIRIYVGKNDVIFTRKNCKNEFVNMKYTLNPSFFNSVPSYMYDFKTEDILGTKIEYFKDFLPNIPNKIRGLMSYYLLKYPTFEKLYKLGLEKYINHAYLAELDAIQETLNPALEIDNELYCDVYAPLKIVFGVNNIESNNIFSFLGLSSYQLKTIIEKFTDFNENLSYHEQNYPIKEIKALIGKDDISSIDQNTFNSYLECYSEYYYFRGRKVQFYKVIKSLELIRTLYSPQMEQNMISKVFMLATTPVSGNRMNVYGDYENPALNYYYDYLSMVKKINDTRNFRPNFNNAADVKLMHDNITEIYNLHKEEYSLKAFESRKDIWKKFLYSNNNYAVIMPDKPEELAKEGIELHHCVKSYISKVTDGITNILFLRKKEELDKPFFTIEISNSGVIEQIHGFGNRNVSTEEGLNQFVEEWKEKKRLKSSNFNKTR